MMSEIPLSEISELEQGDSLTVKYETSHGNMTEKSGEVTHVSATGVNVDTGDETDSGHAICFRVTSYGMVESLTGGNARRISSGVSDSKKTEVWKEQDASESGNSERDAPEDMEVSEIRKQRRTCLIAYALENDSEIEAREGVRARDLTDELDSRGKDYVDHSEVFAFARNEIDDLPNPSEFDDGHGYTGPKTITVHGEAVTVPDGFQPTDDDISSQVKCLDCGVTCTVGVEYGERAEDHVCYEDRPSGEDSGFHAGGF